MVVPPCEAEFWPNIAPRVAPRHVQPHVTTSNFMHIYPVPEQVAEQPVTPVQDVEVPVEDAAESDHDYVNLTPYLIK